jgi:hypothetical protein
MPENWTSDSNSGICLLQQMKNDNEPPMRPLFDFDPIPSLSNGHGGREAPPDFMTLAFWGACRTREL